MKLLQRAYFIVLLVFLSSLRSWGQTDIKQQYAADTAAAYGLTQLYLHTDKSIYVHNENIWFAGYILKTAFDLDDYHTLYVCLSNRLTDSIVATEKFVLLKGFAAGYLFLPDSVPPGDYNLLAYTNLLNKESFPAVYQQQISLRSAKTEPFSISFEPNQSRIGNDSCYFMARISTADDHYADGAMVAYTILADGQAIKKAMVRINQYGEMPVSFLLKPGAAKYELEARVQKDKRSYALRMPVTPLSKRVSFRWFPESGDLVNGIRSKVAFEAMDLAGKPVALEGYLLEDGKKINRIQTNATGLGVTELIPASKSTYSFQPDEEKTRNIAINFPEIKAAGYVMSVADGVVKDSITVRINSTEKNKKLVLLAHTITQEIGTWQLDMQKDFLTVKIRLPGLEPGLLLLTLMDDTGVLLAERSVITGYDRQPLATLSADSAQYRKRSAVKVRLKMTDSEGKPVKAVFSASAVLRSRIDPANFQDIVAYYYFNEYMQAGLIQKASLAGLGTKDDLEMFLLTKCWSRYRQQADTAWIHVSRRNPLRIGGVVKTLTKKAKLPVELSVIQKEGLFFLSTDAEGRFELPPDMTMLQPDTKLQLVVNTKFKNEYSIVLDQTPEIDQYLSRLSFPDVSVVKAALPAEEKKMLNNVKTLNKVVVKSTPKDQYASPPYVSKMCDDYVCMYNILNCPNHPHGAPAISGNTYLVNGQPTLYICESQQNNNTLLYQFKGRYYTKEFYVADYSKFNPPEPETLSTIYWSPQTMTDDKGEYELNFYTNDLPGIYTLIVEGVYDAGVISGSAIFSVAP